MDLLAAYDHSSDEAPASGSPPGSQHGKRPHSQQEQHNQAGIKRPKLTLPGALELLEGNGASLVDLQEQAHTTRLTTGANDATPEWKRPDALGRVRSFAPKEGTYATTVMIPVCLPPPFIEVLRTLVAQLQQLIPGLHAIGHVAESCALSTAATQAVPAPCGTLATQATGKLAAGTFDRNASRTDILAPPCQGTHQDPGSEAGRNNASTRIEDASSSAAAVPASSSGTSATVASEVLHLSLSRTLPLRFHLVSSLLQELAEQLKACRGFSLTLAGTECFLNDERTRSFIAIPLQRSGTEDQQAFQRVRQMIGAVNKAFLMHGLQPYYKDPRPHISIAWVAGDQEQALLQALQQLPASLVMQLQCTMPVASVVCRLGTREHIVWGPAAGHAHPTVKGRPR